jgi:hypothetical protein
MRSWPISEGVAATMKVCKCCGTPVRFVPELDEYFHINGFPQLETIAREVTDKEEVSQL